MRLIELVKLVWLNMLQNKFKVLSTSLGIVVGAVTIVLVIAIGQGGEEQAAQQFSGLSADTITINPDYSKMGDQMQNIPKLTPTLLQTMGEENPYLQGMYLRNSFYQEIRFGKEKEYCNLAGVTDHYTLVSNLSFAAGGDFGEEERDLGKRVVILGSRLAKKQFGSEGNAIGKKIQIKDKKYTVIGVLSRSEEGMQGLSFDDAVLMPYETMEKEKLAGEFSIPQAVGKAKGVDQVKAAIQELKSALNFYLTDGSLYVTEDAGSRIEAATASARTMKSILVSVACIVFVVGGIGIMNVLFVTIRERTGEIGVLKALGSTNGAILLQFLLESVAIGVFSGTVGMGLSLFALRIMAQTDLPLSPSIEGMLAAFFFSVLTSALFGLYPACKAAGLKPVEALEFE